MQDRGLGDTDMGTELGVSREQPREGEAVGRLLVGGAGAQAEPGQEPGQPQERLAGPARGAS